MSIFNSFFRVYTYDTNTSRSANISMDAVPIVHSTFAWSLRSFTFRNKDLKWTELIVTWIRINWIGLNCFVKESFEKRYHSTMSRVFIPNVCVLREGLGGCYKAPWTTNLHALSRRIYIISHISGPLEMRYKSSWLVTEYIKHITACVSEVEPLYGSVVMFATVKR